LRRSEKWIVLRGIDSRRLSPFEYNRPEGGNNIIKEGTTTVSLTTQLANHVRDVHFGGNWTDSNLRDTLSDVTWRQATTRVRSFNTIAALVFHVDYFVSAVLNVLQGGPLDANDAYSFDLPPIDSQEDWERLLEKVWSDAATFADLIEELPEERLWEDFVDGKYGSYYRNIQGIIEHTHYHLGQIVLLKKIVAEDGGE
jgi:hypothetical protein